MFNYSRNFLHSLLAYEAFNVDEHAEVETPEYEIPACAVPQTCTEPDNEQVESRYSFSENRNVKQATIPNIMARKNVITVLLKSFFLLMGRCFIFSLIKPVSANTSFFSS